MNCPFCGTLLTDNSHYHPPHFPNEGLPSNWYEHDMLLRQPQDGGHCRNCEKKAGGSREFIRVANGDIYTYGRSIDGSIERWEKHGSWFFFSEKVTRESNSKPIGGIWRK